MPCTITPYNLLTGQKQTGGRWSLASGGPVNISVNGGAFSVVSNGNNIGNAHDITLGFDQTAANVYVLRYSVGVAPCVDTADLTITVVAGAKAGIDRTETYCNVNNTQINLFDLLRGGNGSGTGTGVVDNNGVWSGTGTVGNPAYIPGGTVPTDDVFQPNLTTFGPGVTNRTFTFVYTVTKNGDPTCDNCVDTATITINVTLQPNAGGDASVTVCNAL